MFYNLAYKYKHWRHRDQAAATPLKPLYDHSPIRSSQLFYASRLLVIDCEMSGLDVKSCQLLSVGWVVIEKGKIINSSAKQMLIHADKGAGSSTKIHGLIDSNIAGASSVASLLMLLIRQMNESVLVFHHAPLDIRFLQKAAKQCFHCPLLFSFIDTMEVEKKRVQLHGKVSGLRLAQCRQRYGLPPVTQHNALADAQATAELLLAQASYLGNRSNLKLSSLLLASARM